MAKKDAPTRRVLIRQALRDHTDSMPSDLADMLNALSKKEGYGLEFGSGEISTYKSKMKADELLGGRKKSQSAAAPKASRAQTNGSISSTVQHLVTAVDNLGADGAKRLIDVLGSLKK